MARLKLTGQRFGRLLVEGPRGINKRGATLWFCHCDCGNTTTVIGGYLTFGLTNSCGCLRRERSTLDLIGQRFGKLVAVSRGSVNSKGYVTWMCKCDCGKELTVSSYKLSLGRKISCGCEGNKLPFGRAARNRVLKQYLRNAKMRKYEWHITNEQFDNLTKSSCHYCGRLPFSVQTSSPGCNTGTYTWMGIDRKDNSQGYNLDNVVPCCQTCNRAKYKMGYEEFITYIGILANQYVKNMTSMPLIETTTALAVS